MACLLFFRGARNAKNLFYQEANYGGVGCNSFRNVLHFFSYADIALPLDIDVIPAMLKPSNQVT